MIDRNADAYIWIHIILFLFFLIVFIFSSRDYNCNISHFPLLLSPPKIPLFLFQIHGLFFSCYCMHVHICIYIYSSLHKYCLFSLYSITCFYVFRGYHYFLLNYKDIVHELHDWGQDRQQMSVVQDRTCSVLGSWVLMFLWRFCWYLGV